MRERPAEQPLTTDVSLAENPEPRCPVVLLLDTSDSMGGEGIRALNSAVATLNQNLHADQLASLRIEIALVAVGGTARVLDVRGRGGVVEPTGDAFAPVDSFVPPTLEADGLTPLGEGMRLALRLLRSRKDELRAQALHLFRPWILLISDGAPNDYGWEHAADAAKDEERRNGVSVYPVGVKDANMTCLARFSTRPPLKLRGYDFESLFRWLSDSLQITSGSRPGEVVQLPHPAWTETTA